MAGKVRAVVITLHAITRPAEHAEGEGYLGIGSLFSLRGDPRGRDHGRSAEFLAAESGQGRFGNAGVLENDSLQRGAQRGLDGGNESFLDLYMLGEGSLDGALEEIGVVEAFENSLRSFIQALALLLKLAQNFKAGLEAGGFLAGSVKDGLGILAFLLGVLVVCHGRGSFSLGVLQCQMGGIRAAFQIFEIRGNLGGGMRGGCDFILQQMKTRLARFPASGGCGNLATERIQTCLGV